MDRAELVWLLYRAARSERRYAGAVEVRHVAAAEARLERRQRERFGAGAGAGRLLRFMDRSEPADWPDSREEFPDGGGEYTAERLLRPGWLLSGWELTVTGEDATGVRVTAVRRPAATDAVARSYGDGELSCSEAVMDPESGVLLRLADYFDGELCRTTELFEVRELPGAAAGKVTGGDGDEDAEDAEGAAVDEGDEGDDTDFQVPEVVRLAARGFGTAVGGAIRLGTKLRPAPAPEPDDEPWFGSDAGAVDPAGGPVPTEDELVALLYDGPRGRGPFTARVDVWQDVEALTDTFASAELGPLAGFFGPEAMWSAIGDAIPARLHLMHRVVVTDLLHYRVETLLGTAQKRPAITACDGTTLYRRYPDRLVRAAAAPPDLSVSRMIDPTWLLARAQLTVHGWTALAGRRVLCLSAKPLSSDGPDPVFLFPCLELLLDVEFGVLLRLTAFRDGEPAGGESAGGEPDGKEPGEAEPAGAEPVGNEPEETEPVGREPAGKDRADTEPPGKAPGEAEPGARESGPERSPVARVELRGLRAAEPGPEEFRLDPPASGRTVTDTGGPFGDSALPAPLKAAAEVAGTLAGGAMMLAGLLGRSRKQQ